MIIELRDILDNKHAVAHARAPGMSLGEIFDKDAKLKAIAPHVVQVSVNGSRSTVWRHIIPQSADRIVIDVAPKEPFSIGAIISAIITVVSVVQFAISLFNRPKVPKLETPKDSPTYSFDGIKTSFSPGGPVPVNYGEHLVGGQLLSMAVDVHPTENNRQQLSMLIGLGVGPITDVSCIRLNDIALENFRNEGEGVIVCQAAAEQYWIDRPDVAADPFYGASPAGAYQHYLNHGQSEGSIWHAELCGDIAFDFRLGTSSQSPIPGFQQVRNTFADGREISSNAITYVSQGDRLDSIQLQVAAMEGLGIFFGGTNPRLSNQLVRYSIEYKRSDWSTDSWAFFEAARDFHGQSRGEVWDAPFLNLADREGGSRSAWDIRLAWLNINQPERPGKNDTSLHRIWLRNVTEISEERTESYSGTALLAIKAIATNQLQGGAPNVTCMVRGRPVRAYSDETTYVETWTRNPAWCLLDYMTNSVYGMGAYIPTSGIHLQSFIDFATICNSLVSDGAGSLEPQHVLDLTMDRKKPHWTWIQDILGLYRSAMIYSQGKFKIITDRGDRPVRQVFHAGNIVPGTFQLTIGATDPIKPNQATVTFPNRNTDFNLDTIFIQNSESVLGNNEPIKEFEMSLIGITRESEAVREAHWQLNRRRQAVREAKFKTGLEALAVEPGDMAKVGVVTTDFELGYGGRLLDGDLFHLVLDREVEVKSGYPYELYLWHTGADSVETRTLVTTPGSGYTSFKTAVISPGNPLNITPNIGDRWAIGITSEDLMLGWVKKITRDPDGLHELTVEQFIPSNPVTPTLVSTNWWGVVDLNAPPPQPISVVGCAQAVRQIDGTWRALTTIDVVPAPREEGGKLTNPATTASVTLDGSHSPNNDSINLDHIVFVFSGTSTLRYHGNIVDWDHVTRVATITPQFVIPPFPDSGDAYTIVHRGGDWAGFELHQRSTTSSVYALVGPVLGTHHEHTSDIESASAVYKIIPFNSQGVRNRIGCWQATIGLQGNITGPGTPSGLAATINAKGAILDWLPNTESDLSHYTLHRAESNAFHTSSLIVALRSDQFLDANVTPSNTYYYWVRAWDTMSNASPIHPGSTAGVLAVARAINQSFEVSATNSFWLTSALVSVQTATFESQSGNWFLQAGFVAATTSFSVQQQLSSVLRLYPFGVNSTGVPETLAGRDIMMTGSSEVAIDLSTTEVFSEDTYLLSLDIQFLGVSSKANVKARHILGIETLPQ